MAAGALSPTLVWGLFTRGLGLVFLISFLSLAAQVRLSARLTPFSARLAKIKEDFPTWRRFYYFPTLLWLNSSGAAMLGVAVLGAAAASLVIYGGPFSFWALVTCYVCYLSLDMVMALIFPWDCLLFECTVLALFLPATEALPSLHAVAAPAPALTWAYRLLVFRVLFGFGKQKFLGSRTKDLAYLKGFLISQPLPSKVAWYAHKLPNSVLKAGVVFLFFAEIPAPFFAFIPGLPSLVLVASTILLMIGIQLMGNFGYFNLATIVLSITLLDNTTPAVLELTRLFSAGQPVLVNAFIVLHTLFASFAFLFNSWLGQSWHLWAFWYQLPRFVQPLFTFLRFMHPFRWVHPYGVFPPNTTPGAKITILLEGSWDKATWHELDLHFCPSNPRSPPRFIAPYHPRLDQAVIYDTFGLNPTSLLSSVLGGFDPYAFGSRLPAVGFCQAILRGSGLSLVGGRALATHAGPPLLVRMTTVMLEPVSLEEHRKTGVWWKRSYVGPHVPPQELDLRFSEDASAEPELWHFDAIFWRRRSRLRGLMDRALSGKENPMQLATADAGNLSAADVERFWDDFVPMISGSVRERFETLPDIVAELEQRWDRRQRRALHRLLGRFSALLIARLEPLYLYRGFHPLIPARTYFQLWMLVHHIIGSGRQAYLEVFANPISAADHLSSLTNQTGLYPHAVFRLEQMTFEAQKLRLLNAYMFPHDEESKRANAAKVRTDDVSALLPAERLMLRVARRISGFSSVFLDIRESFKGPRFNRGYPERYPSFQELDSGEVVVRANRPQVEAEPGLNASPGHRIA